MFVPLMFTLAKLPRHQGPIAPSELTGVFRRSITHPFVKITTKRSKLVTPNRIYVGGTYDPEEDRNGDPCIEVFLIYNEHDQHLTLEQKPWQRLCFEIAECIGHEFVHRTQARRRKFKDCRNYRSRDEHVLKKEEQEYLGTKDEIEAYGFSIAAELSAMYGSFDIESPHLENIVMWKVYNSTFDNDQTVLLKLRQQIVKYLHRLEVDYHDKTNSRTSRARRPRNL